MAAKTDGAKKERRNQGCLRRPDQGALHNSTRPDAPFRERGPSTACIVQEPEGPGWSFVEAETRSSRFVQIVFMAVRSARQVVSSLSNVVWSLIGCPSSKGDRSMLSLVGKFQGAKPGRSGEQRYERRETAIARGIAWPPVCNQASRPDAYTLPFLGGGNNHPSRHRANRRRGPGRHGIDYTLPVSLPSFAPAPQVLRVACRAVESPSARYGHSATSCHAASRPC